MRGTTIALLLLVTCTLMDAFTIPIKHTHNIASKKCLTKIYAETEEQRTISAKTIDNDAIEFKASAPTSTGEPSSTAKTNTVNERLLAELQAATDAEKGPKTKVGAKFKDSFKYSEKSDEEREAALEAAKDLNGVNPTVTILASFFAFGMAIGLWGTTQYLAGLFMTHPVPADAPYAFTRAASVFRNAVMGLISLASGFSLVSGLGVFLLGCRVAYGVFTGELDPTPIKKVGLKNDEFEIPNVWDLMTNKKPNRKNRR
jgi:hypothetical protein